MTASITLSTKAGVKIAVNAVVHEGGGGGGVTAHADLTGLTTGDDHTQYQRSESTFTSASSFTVTDQSTVVSTGSTVVLPDAQTQSGRYVLVGAGADLTVQCAGTDVFLDGTGSTTFAVQNGNGVGFTSVNAGGTWGWAVTTRQGSSYDLPKWVGQSLAAGKVLRIDGTGAPAWANVDAADVPSLAASKITSGTFDVARLPVGTTSTTVAAGNDSRITGAVQGTRTVNGKALSSDVTLTAADVSAVPTARTVNSKALSADVTLTASDVGAVPTTRTVNGSALSSDITISAAPSGSAGGDLTGTYPNPTIGTGAVTSAKIADGTIVNADISASAAIATSKISGLATVATSGSASDLSTGTLPTARLVTPMRRNLFSHASLTSGGSATVGTGLYDPGSYTTQAVALGDLLLVPAIATTDTVSRIGWEVTASSSTGSQKFSVVCYSPRANGLPGALAWSEDFDAVTVQAAIAATTTGRTIADGSWVGVHVPSTNAGSVTFRAGTPITPYVMAPSSASGVTRMVLHVATGASTPPSDLSTYTVGAASAGSTTINLTNTVRLPLIWARKD